MKAAAQQTREQNPVQSAKTWLALTIAGQVDRPNDVTVETVGEASTVIFEVRVHREDVRRVIGRRGVTADALRTLLINLGSKAGRRFHLEILEPAPARHVVIGPRGNC